MPTPWLCLQDDLRRAGVDPATLNRVSGPSMADNAAALRAGALDAVQLFQPYAEELIASGAGHVWYAAADRGLTAYTTLVTRRPLLAIAARRTAAHDARDRAHAALDRRDAGRRHRPRAGGFLPRRSPPAIFAAAMDRYRALELFAADPVLRREGFDRLQAAMRSGGALDRAIPFERCVDNSLAEQALADSVRPAIATFAASTI